MDHASRQPPVVPAGAVATTALASESDHLEAWYRACLNNSTRRGAFGNGLIMAGSCRVLLVDDHAVFRETLAVGLSQEEGVAIVGQASTTAEGLECVHAAGADGVDVVVLDLSLPGRGGGDLVAQIAQRYPSIAILILTSHPADRFIGRLISQGANGYLHKSCSLQEVMDAVRTVGNGGRVVSPEIEALSEGGAEEPHEMLSNREYQVMERLVQGASITSIAEEMNLSVKTISTYRKRLMEKLGMASNSDLVAYAIQQGIVNR